MDTGPGRTPDRRPPGRRRPGLVGVAVLVVAGLLAAGLVVLALDGAGGGAGPDVQDVTGAVVVTDFGAVPDDDGDDTAALARAVAAAAPGATLVLAPGAYRVTGMWELDVPGLVVRAPGARLMAADPEQSAVRISAPDVVVEGLAVHADAPARVPGRPRAGFWLAGSSGTVLREVAVSGTAAAGIVADGATGFRIERAEVRGTAADGIHVTGGSRDGVIDRPVVIEPGDDGVSVVSYRHDPAVSAGIEVLAPTVRGQVHGRALSVVGGADVRFSDIDVDGSGGAAVYVAVEAGRFDTMGVSDVEVTGGRIRGANVDPGADHGAVTVFLGAPDAQLARVSISGLSIEGTRREAGADVQVKSRAGARPEELTFTDLDITAGPPRPYGGNVPADLYQVD